MGSIEERNQQNAQHSTGPQTEAGKARSARNSGKHLLTATHPQSLPEDLQIEFDLFHQAWIDFYQPQNPVETYTVEQLAFRNFLLQQVPLLIFDAQVQLGDDPELMSKTMDRYMGYETRLHRAVTLYTQRLGQLRHHPLTPLPAKSGGPVSTPTQPELSPEALAAQQASMIALIEQVKGILSTTTPVQAVQPADPDTPKPDKYGTIVTHMKPPANAPDWEVKYQAPPMTDAEILRRKQNLYGPHARPGDDPNWPL